MFTGIVEEIGTVHSVLRRSGSDSAVTGADAHDIRLVIEMHKITDPPLGSSIAVDGVCLTVVQADADGLVAFDVMPQTLKLTTLGTLQPGSRVNLERAALVTSRLDGHVVQGHVDGTATLVSRQPGPRWDWLRFELPTHLLPYLAMQGSITVSGVSLTVASLDQSGFCVALIPTTLADTTLGDLRVGQQVNIEVDALAKYADRLRQTEAGQLSLSETALSSVASGDTAAPAGFSGDAPWLTASAGSIFNPARSSSAASSAAVSTPRLSINKIAEAELPTQWGKFQISIFRDQYGTDHVALTAPAPSTQAAGGAPLVRVHSECLTGDAFGSLRCDCGPQLHTAMSLVAAQGGAIIYMRGHEGRGIGLAAKIAAYTLQDQGRDTVQANEDLGYPVDARDYAAAATILRALGMPEVRLLTNNPAKQQGLEEVGVKVVELVPLEVGHGPENRTYLETKRARLGHTLQFDDGVGDGTGGADVTEVER